MASQPGKTVFWQTPLCRGLCGFLLLLALLWAMAATPILPQRWRNTLADFFPHSSTNHPLYLLITVDVETPCKSMRTRFPSDVFLEGRPAKPNGQLPVQGVPGIVRMLQKRHLVGNFFMNVYEWLQDPQPTTMAHLSQWLIQHGQEVALHSHPNPDLPFYTQDIVHYSLPDQQKIIHYGDQLLQQWTGQAPIAYRGGAYYANDDTLRALSAEHILIDSSMFASNPHNQWSSMFTLNHPTMFQGVTELPITVAYRHYPAGHVMIKMDPDWISARDILAIIEQAKNHHLSTLVLIFHSFSLMRFDRRSPASCFQTLTPDTVKQAKLERLLDTLEQDPDLHVVTFHQWYQHYQHLALSERPVFEYLPVLD